MSYITLLLKDIVKRPSLYFLLFFVIYSVDRHHRFEHNVNKDTKAFSGDIFEYYSFLPEYFLDHERVPGINFTTSKRTIGMAVMYSPAFFVGHSIAGYTHVIQDGYSEPYQRSVRWLSMIYCFFGLVFCRKNLLLFFKEPLVAITLACVFFGTNLFYYTYGSGEYPHGYLFFLNSAFIYFTLNWILRKKPGFLIAVCFTGGMITLIRPTGILVFLFPVLFNISSFKDLTERLNYLFEKPLGFILALLLFLLPLVFQALIWKTYQGHYVHYSYKEERFFFNDPQIINFLFSIRKGWLVYTPVMLLALAGMFLSVKRLKAFSLFNIVYFSVTVYVLSSWWDWAYGGSFGCRALVESYAFFVFPFAVCVAWLWDLKKERRVAGTLVRITVLLVFYLLIELNIFQTRQFKYGRIHWNGMNWETYKAVFLKDITTEESNYLNTRFTPPDPQKMMRGERDN